MLVCPIRGATATERGLIHGKKLKREINDYYQYWLENSFDVKIGSEEEERLLDIAILHSPFIRKYSGDIGTELDAIAYNSGLSYERLLLMNCFADYGFRYCYNHNSFVHKQNTTASNDNKVNYGSQEENENVNYDDKRINDMTSRKYNENVKTMIDLNEIFAVCDGTRGFATISKGLSNNNRNNDKEENKNNDPKEDIRKMKSRVENQFNRSDSDNSFDGKADDNEKNDYDIDEKNESEEDQENQEDDDENDENDNNKHKNRICTLGQSFDLDIIKKLVLFQIENLQTNHKFMYMAPPGIIGGSGLNQFISFSWYPRGPSSKEFCVSIKNKQRINIDNIFPGIPSVFIARKMLEDVENLQECVQCLSLARPLTASSFIICPTNSISTATSQTEITGNNLNQNISMYVEVDEDNLDIRQLFTGSILTYPMAFYEQHPLAFDDRKFKLKRRIKENEELCTFGSMDNIVIEKNGHISNNTNAIEKMERERYLQSLLKDWIESSSNHSSPQPDTEQIFELPSTSSPNTTHGEKLTNIINELRRNNHHDQNSQNDFNSLNFNINNDNQVVMIMIPEAKKLVVSHKKLPSSTVVEFHL